MASVQGGERRAASCKAYRYQQKLLVINGLKFSGNYMYQLS